MKRYLVMVDITDKQIDKLKELRHRLKDYTFNRTLIEQINNTLEAMSGLNNILLELDIGECIGLEEITNDMGTPLIMRVE